MSTIGITTELIDKKINSKIEPPDDYRDSIFNSGFERGFYNGAMWRVTDVWHNSSEVPENKWLIILLKTNPANDCFIPVAPRTCKKAGYEMLLREENENIVAWAYIADLLPAYEKKSFKDTINDSEVEIEAFTTALPGNETIALI